VIIENEFTVAAELDTVWRELLDMEGVATCLPGATITATDQENVYHGSMRLKIGPMRVEYRGTATLSEVHEQTHTAVISLSAREAKGQGFARATIRNQLQATGSGTRVTAQTELQITGPQAQFGRGVIEDVGKRVLGEFARCLEQKIGGQVDGTGAAAGGGADAAGGPSGTVQETAGVAPGETTGAGVGATGPGVVAGETPERALAPVTDELDVGSLLASSPAARRAAALAVLALMALAAAVLLRRRR
jgi:carbon monoxide dehydrogenase subunit G